ncbi:MAG: hypothetical protein ACLFMM_02420, partial [Methanohalobium sp.]|uniref:hypothetical protein n=1 Tax=Methanohalobium sp. TaxID=2837493 RepID=UPI00397D3E75
KTKLEINYKIRKKLTPQLIENKYEIIRLRTELGKLINSYKSEKKNVPGLLSKIYTYASNKHSFHIKIFDSMVYKLNYIENNFNKKESYESYKFNKKFTWIILFITPFFTMSLLMLLSINYFLLSDDFKALIFIALFMLVTVIYSIYEYLNYLKLKIMSKIFIYALPKVIYDIEKRRSKVNKLRSV